MFLKTLLFIWPFLREMILGDQTLPTALRRNKGRVLLIGLIVLSIFLNFFTIPKLVAISAEYVALKKRYDNEAPIKNQVPKVPKPPRVDPNVTITTPVKITHPPTDDGDDGYTEDTIVPHDEKTRRYLKAKEAFERMKQRESGTR